MENKKKGIKKIIIPSIICVIVLGIAAYFIFENFMKKDFRENPDYPDDSERRGGFPSLNETTKAKITSFFESSPSSSEIEDYCNKNRGYCFYYCVNMKGNNEFCKELMNNTKMPPGGEPPQ